MADSGLLPVLAGLTVGIGFVIALSFIMSNLPYIDVDGCCGEIGNVTFGAVLDLGIGEDQSQSIDTGASMPVFYDEVGTPEWIFFEGRCYPEEGQLTIAVNSREGTGLGMRGANIIEPAAIEKYPMLQNMIHVADRKPEVIFCSSISISDAELLIADKELGFAQTCGDVGGSCIDELSSIINFGNNTSYVIRIFEGEDPFAPEDEDDDVPEKETGVFPYETDVGEPIPVEVLDDNNNTSIEIEYEKD